MDYRIKFMKNSLVKIFVLGLLLITTTLKAEGGTGFDDDVVDNQEGGTSAPIDEWVLHVMVAAALGAAFYFKRLEASKSK